MNPEDKDPIETSEWLDAINSVIEEEGIERASFLMTKLAKRLNEEGAIPTYNLTTPFRNSIPVKTRLKCLVICLWKEELDHLLGGML